MNRWYRWEKPSLLLYIRLQPKACKDEFVGPYQDHYKVRITAPPVDGKANTHLLRFLAKSFGVSKSAVTLISGNSSRNKCVRIIQPTKCPLQLGIEGI